MVDVPLIKLCYARSGDKGDVANVGVIARDPAYYPFLHQTLTEDVVRRFFAHVAKGTVRRFEGNQILLCYQIMVSSDEA